MFINVLSSIVATVIAFFCGIFWNKYLSDQISDIFYKGIKIDGTWKFEEKGETAKGYTLSFPSVYTISIKQFSNKISGTAKAEFGQTRREIVHYLVKGSIKDRFVFLTLTINEKNRISYCTFLLEVIGNGRKMIGYINFYALITKEINAMEVCLEYLGV